ncbi:MAG: dihydropteroate synthase [Roseofilum sp. SBFL]|uniref:dihydropteroate synthase n=1 Tax=unclassified Roseofilum TaxID=2620099 RepID=UPI001B1CC1FB|nr:MULTISPECIES: dihydropteroate synthase [unclassified Roseofilum]MBP0012231.1 dihydropteroate synthase [Roseofilum sp. SID3]MBP0025768.1 dihydropteroate synthase [Roseofilum sp. SID2]MBP0036850.1 dihydropteroate synthase [Roseofilum sp. SID1]MBP0044148.1 dihydropteroate synthase [Roseofilum sp. SBFL]
MAWIVRGRSFDWGMKTYIMGVLNVTPDSFSDGGEFNRLETAIAHSQYLVDRGVDVVDIGGQSTRPGSPQISLDEELNRAIPVIEGLRNLPEPYGTIPVSIDTTRSEVAQAAVEAGADWVNDISGGDFDSQMLATVAHLRVPIILMHMRGTPETMQQLTNYEDLMGEIVGVLGEKIQKALKAGIQEIIIDPGIGFAKTYDQNVQILRQIPGLRELGYPVLIGASRKSFIGHILNEPDPKKRVWGTAAACCAAISGGADMVRVHDLPQMVEVCRVADAIYRGESASQ